SARRRLHPSPLKGGWPIAASDRSGGGVEAVLGVLPCGALVIRYPTRPRRGHPPLKGEGAPPRPASTWIPRSRGRATAEGGGGGACFFAPSFSGLSREFTVTGGPHCRHRPST